MRVAQELRDGMTVNLGIGLPTLVANFLPEGATILFHAENGILGYGAMAEDEWDQDQINAGGQPVTLIPGASFFDSAAVVRHDPRRPRRPHRARRPAGVGEGRPGELGLPGRPGGAIGGAMDLAAGARRVIVAMEHTTREGEPRILEECTYPLTAQACVDLIVTNLGVIEVTPEGLVLREVAPGVTAEEVQAATGAPLTTCRRT